MAESTLNMKMSDLAGEVGSFLGYGAGADNGERAWNDTQKSRILMALRSGLRQFYFPPPVPPERESYSWSFLRPTATITLAEGGTEVGLPDDFGGFEGRLALSAGDGGACWPCEIRTESYVRDRFAQFPSTNGQPSVCAVAPQRGGSHGRSPRSNLVWFPAADRDYTASFQYYLLPDALTPASPWAYGGATHAETLVESCLAIAEQRLDDAMAVHTQKFMERLAASVSLDRRKKAQCVGYNGDDSDRLDRGYDPSWRRGNPSVTFNGVQYALWLAFSFL